MFWAIALLTTLLVVDPYISIQAVEAERAGDYARALQLWRHISRTQQTALGAVGEAKICWILNKPSDAKAALAVALKRDPKCSPALSLLARLQLSEGDVDAAKTNLEAACATDPNNAEAQRLLADLLAHAGMLDDAAPHYGQLLKLQPASVHARQNVVAYLATHHRIGEATKICHQGLQSKDAPPLLKLELGHLYTQSDRMTDAYEAFKAAREVGSHDTEPYQMLAIVCGARGDWVSSLNYAQSFCDIDAGSVNPIILAAWAAYGSNDLLEAKNRLEEANTILADNADLRNLYALVLMDLHRWPAAAEQLMDAEKADPSNPFVKMNNAMLQLATDKPAEALTIAEAVAIENPDLLPAKSLLAFVLLENGKSAEAAALANEVIKADNSDVVAHVVAARILRNEGKFDDALLQLNHAQNNGDGATSFLQIELADTLLAKGDIAKATTAAQFALQLAPASLDAKHALARTLERQGNWEGAALYLRELSARKPKDLAAKLELANALVQSGDSVGAQLTYEAAEKLAPNSRDVLLGLSKVATMQGNKRLSRSLLRRAEKIQSPSSSNSATRATNPSQPR